MWQRMWQSFNPRAREGRDQRQDPQQCRPRVSIHAPVKGATPSGRACGGGGGVSIHAPVKGATRFFKKERRKACFNPRAREGRDAVLAVKRETKVVSIHAPVKGATQAGDRDRARRDVSIHAPVKGATCRVRGCRRPARFNPRAREGRDNARAQHHAGSDVSIHAPVKGATTARRALTRWPVFQSTRP